MLRHWLRRAAALDCRLFEHVRILVPTTVSWYERRPETAWVRREAVGPSLKVCRSCGCRLSTITSVRVEWDDSAIRYIDALVAVLR